MFVIYFVENYIFKVQLWFHNQCIGSTVQWPMYHTCTYLYSIEEGKLHKKSILYILDDTKHDYTIFST